MGGTDYYNNTITTGYTTTGYTTADTITIRANLSPWDYDPDAPLNVRRTEVEKLRGRVNAVRVKLVA
jgi:hypothetical protein